MRQQINLYQPIFSEARKPLSGLHVAMVLGLVATGLIAYSVHSSMRLNKLAAEVAVLRDQQAEQESLLSEATAASTARSNPAEIEARVKQLTTSLGERTRALQLLKSGAAGQTTGFADRLQALARRRVEGLWIDHLVISGSNGSMSLAGATLNADIVPTYLQNLAQEPALAGTRFDEFVIQRPSADTEAEDVAADEVKKPVRERFVRFHAGNKSLDATRPESET